MRLPSLSRIVGGLPWRYFFAALLDGVEEMDWNDRLVSHHLPAWGEQETEPCHVAQRSRQSRTGDGYAPPIHQRVVFRQDRF